MVCLRLSRDIYTCCAASTSWQYEFAFLIVCLDSKRLIAAFTTQLFLVDPLLIRKGPRPVWRNGE
jgi:hypothetical protein